MEEQLKKDIEEQKRKKQDKMNVYRETLEYQQQIQDFNKDGYGAMT